MSEEDLSSTPLWKFVTKKNKVKGGGNWNFICNQCNTAYTGSYGRMKAHLLKIPGQSIRVCSGIREPVLMEARKLNKEAEARAIASVGRTVSLPTSASGSGSSFASSSSGIVEDPQKKRKTNENPLQKMLNSAKREELDSQIARLFYSAGLPFHLAKNPHFINSYKLATADSKSIQGYIPPGYNKLRTTLLNNERAHIEKEMHPIKNSWNEKGVSIVTDGWTDEQRRPLINFIAVSEAGPMFIKAINTQGSVKDKEYISRLIMETIAEIGHRNIVQVITDNAPVCKSAGLLVEEPILTMLRLCDTDKPRLHLVYEMWDQMIDDVKNIIYRKEGLQDTDISPFHMVVDEILTSRWSKSNTPLIALAHALNPRYYTYQWLNEVPTRVAPHRDPLISSQRLACFERYYDGDELHQVNVEYAKFCACLGVFGSGNSLNARWSMNPYIWWVTYGVSTPFLQVRALKLLGQPCSSSCSERNWSTYSFINSVKRNRITSQRGEDLVYVHSNLRLISRRSPEYMKGDTRMWDVGGDAFDTMQGAGLPEIAYLSLDDPEM